MFSSRDKDTVNTIHFKCTESKSVSGLVLAAEPFLVNGHHIGGAFAYPRRNLLQAKFDLTKNSDFYSVSALCISSEHTIERRLLIDLLMIKKAYERGDITDEL